MYESIFRLPIIPLREKVALPYARTSFEVGRLSSIAAVEFAEKNNGLLGLFTQKYAFEEVPEEKDIERQGTLVRILQIFRLPGGVYRVTVEGISRIELKELTAKQPYYTADVEAFNTPIVDATKVEALASVLFDKYTEFTSTLQLHPLEDKTVRAEEFASPESMVYEVANQLPLDEETRQSILDMMDLEELMKFIIDKLMHELQLVEVENELRDTVRQSIDKNQREYFLREKIKVIQEELGDKVDIEEESDELRDALRALALPEDIHNRIEKEIARYERMPTMMPESHILRTYLDWLIALPWNTETEDRDDIHEAARILDEDHYGLERIKERILEFLAVRKLTNKQAGTILCLVGPPGVGKTSLAKSIARALNKNYTRAAFGGLRDEAEIRGHRRTYIGALPGRMIQGLKHAGSKNPVFLLDEVDKIAKDHKGDPSAALLEVLDPEQNGAFSDHYIEIPFDFSQVFWIATANVKSDIPTPLLDRMEVIDLESYTQEEKLQIAKRYLVPKQQKKNGLPDSVKLSDAVLRRIITEYTSEAGVRGLEKTIGKVFRKIAYYLVEEEGSAPRKVTVKNLEDFLGKSIYMQDDKEKKPQVGVVCGLAWTSVGGTVLPCEAAKVPGTGKIVLTGRLGDMMKESAQQAMTYVRSRAEQWNLEDNFYKESDVHIHFPDGATPKDGPSAGITTTTALVSIFTGAKVRHDIAMTGEVTLRGNVLPIGGVKEKLLAAYRHGIKEVLIPYANRKDLVDLPESVRDSLVITPVKTMDEVLERALVK